MNDWKIAAYIRISKADSDVEIGSGKDESNSISNQRDLIRNYVENSPELKNGSLEELFDDGYSGTNFNRPSFEILMDKVRKGSINCIIVKDFSRFGRSYIELGDYLEQIFPVLGVRFISINDGYDSAKKKYGEDGLDVAMKNIVYSYYARDISVKATTSMRQRQKKGRYLGGSVPYGYQVLKGDEKYSIDDDVSAIVVKVFQLAADGTSTGNIAKLLNQEGIETPAEYYNRKHPESKKYKTVSSANGWTSQNVRLMIQNEAYYGAMPAHKREYIAPCSRKSRKVPKEQWIVIEDCHDPIVDKNLWSKAQGAVRKMKNRAPEKSRSYMLKGIVKCGCCGRSLSYNDGVKDNPKFSCNNGRFEQGGGCFSGSIPAKPVNEAVARYIYVLREDSDRMHQAIEDKKKVTANNQKRLSDDIENLAKRLSKVEADQFTNMDSFMGGQLSKDKYLEHRERLRAEAENLQGELAAMRKKQNEVYVIEDPETEAAVQVLEGIRPGADITNEQVKELIEEVRIYDPEHIEIVSKIPDEFLDLIRSRE